ncbi:hypothetical protein [Pseudofrankia sp. BMG5.36]|uniref:hypothetical protein n=1 Tax=Pseudofrankia sp. BMG5.36 TaxID=1834512 RepID=UPI0008D977DA|nr:hypothetical protein [Pseudofrankia sp. BMG5.36]OHV48827.1 hypothetical protein BCD48_14440 [Pseudofrankia sp. BMG5.36]
MELFARAGSWATIVGGVLLAIGAFLHLLPPDYASNEFSQEVTTGAFALTAALRLLGIVLLTWGVVALYARQADRLRAFGLVAVALTMAALVLNGGIVFADLFIAPSIAEQAPAILDGNAGGRLGLGFLLAWVSNLAFLLLGIATLRAKVLARWAGWALVVVGLCPALPLSGTETVIGLGLAAAGLATLRPRTAPVAAAVPTA